MLCALGGARTLGGTATKVLWVVVCTGDMSTGSVRLRPVVPSLKYSGATRYVGSNNPPTIQTAGLSHDSDRIGLKVCRREAHLGPLARHVYFTSWHGAAPVLSVRALRLPARKREIADEIASGGST